ncbi:MAG TPA: trypsin-like peptidase domain-containing protein [Rhodanobacteraceae bacterium]|nr:trypsin-like peptidase domain-containing protein [Rhodanobacteraceae bacterium]
MIAPLKRTLVFLLLCIVVGLALAFVITSFWPGAGKRLRAELGLPSAPVATVQSREPAAPATGDAAPKTSFMAESAGPVSYAEAVRRAAPAVVNIYANKVVTERQVRVYPDPLMRRLFGGIAFGPAYKRREQSLGSGVIFSTDGYVLTNNHVIAGADNIQVLLYDGRVAQARVVGTDADTDLAVLKINADNLPSIVVAQGGPPQVGDVVLAIGNPFGIGQTVTMGIVSALSRQLTTSAYEDFIQTDAAINSGNSGGALINARGELVGINTAIFGRGVGAEGIGFAIPMDTAEYVLQQIIAHGAVVRGWIGADYGALRRQPGGAPVEGVVVMAIYPGSPAAKAGLRVGDVLLQLDGQPIEGPSALRKREAAIKPGTQVSVAGLRAGKAFKVDIVLARRPSFNRQGS